MELSDIEIGLQQLEGIVLSGTNAMKKVMCASDIAFLDTCLIARHYGMKNPQQWRKVILNLVSGPRTVFVLTPLLVYELQGGAGTQMNCEKVEYLRQLRDEGACIVYMPEADIIKAVHQKYNARWGDINRNLCQKVKELAIRFATIGTILRNETCTYRKYIFTSQCSPESDRFSESLFTELYKNKTSKDSMAEELIAIVSLYILEVMAEEEKLCIRFFSDDIAAVGMLANSPLKTFIKAGKFKTVNSVGLLMAMDFKTQYCDCTELAEDLKRLRENFKKIGVREKVYDMIQYDSLSYSELASEMWKGKMIIFPCIEYDTDFQ